MKKFIKILLKTVVSIVGLVALYLLCAYLLPFIEIPAEKTNEPKNVEAYILTNGVHTDLVFPVKSKEIDWSQKFPYEDTVAKDSTLRYIAIGWGDKGFYLDTPTWADLKFSTAFKAAFWLGNSAIHTTFYKEMKLGEDCKKLEMTSAQYQKLIKFIDDAMEKNAEGKYINIKTKAVYGKNDSFYEAKGSYSFLFTCNTWTNEALKISGQKAAFWTASDKGIFQHYQH